MKKVINKIKELYSRIDWNEAKKVELQTMVNLITTIFCYSLTICCIIALFFGAWWQLFIGAISYVFGAVSLNDDQYGAESALHYIERVIR